MIVMAHPLMGYSKGPRYQAQRLAALPTADDFNVPLATVVATLPAVCDAATPALFCREALAVRRPGPNGNAVRRGLRMALGQRLRKASVLAQGTGLDRP